MSNKIKPAKCGRHYTVERQWNHKGNRYPMKDEFRVVATSILVAVRKATKLPMKGFKHVTGSDIVIRITVGSLIQNKTCNESDSGPTTEEVQDYMNSDKRG